MFERLKLRLVEKLLPGVVFGIPGAETWEEARNFDLGLALPGENPDTLTDPYGQHPVVSQFVSIISEDAACVPLELHRTDENGKPTDEVIESHPVLDFLQTGNDWHKGTNLWSVTYAWAVYCGEFFWYYPKARIGRENSPRATRLSRNAELRVLNPNMVVDKVDRQTKQVVFGEKREETRDPVPLDMDKLTQWRRFNPQKPWRGMSMLGSLAKELSFDFNAASWNAQFFGEGNGIPSGLIKPGMTGAMTADQRADLLRTWNQRHGKKRRIGLLPPGAEWVDLGKDQHDMEFNEGRKHAREIMLGSAGLPPFIAGVLENANYANARKQEEVYWQGTIKRLVTSVQNTINRDFLVKLGVRDAVFMAKWQVVNQTLDDFGDKIKIAGQLWERGVPWREINDRLELGLDMNNVPNADESYVSLQMVPSSLLADEPAQQTNGDQSQRGITIADGGETIREVVWRNIANSRRDLERVFEKIMRRHFHEIEREAQKNLERWATGKSVGNLVSITRDEKDLGDLLDRDAIDKRLQRRTGPQYRNGVQRGANSVLAELGLGGLADISFGAAADLVEKLTGKIVTVNETLFNALGTSLLDGLNAGDSLDALRDRVSDVTGLSLGRSRIIARTEMGAAFSGGRFTEMKAAGIEQHEWITSRDPDVRPGDDPSRSKGDHTVLDGQRVPVGQPFSNGVAFPRDPDGRPEETINCRCEAVAVTR